MAAESLRGDTQHILIEGAVKGSENCCYLYTTCPRSCLKASLSNLLYQQNQHIKTSCKAYTSHSLDSFIGQEPSGSRLLVIAPKMIGQS